VIRQTISTGKHEIMKYLKRNGTDSPEDDPLTSKIIGIAIEIHKELGPGFNESIYHRAMEIDLADAGLDFVSEESLAVKYKNRILGTFSADLIVENSVLLELKALETLPLISEVQVVQYLKASRFDIGLILNFGTQQLQIKRKYRNREPISSTFRLHEV
jgi:GxxExxY protein